MTDFKYSPISLMAVASALLGMMSILGLIFPLVALFAVPGVLLGIAAILAIRRYELNGLRLAKAGLTLSLIFGIVSPVWAVTWFEICFRSEALPGYKRVNFREIMQDRKHSASRLVGQNVCFKGYELYSSREKRNSFRMSCQRPPSGFGGKADLEDIALVKLLEGKFWKWRNELIAVSGRLVRNPDADHNPEAPKFILEQSEVFEARTLNGSLVFRGGEGGC
ncbi:MAG: DUF4190 domain-containing protein [Gimesia sp.]|nr:DUF4190 domain-containing protein [Gimesia sp.]